MVDRSGQQLGNYRLLSLLGQGGFAEVYLGEHVFLKKSVAVKLLYTQLGQADMASFLKEAQTIAHLEHPHIVRVTDFGLDNNLPYLIMEYAPNGTLRHRHPRDTTLPLATISSYIKQVANALQYAHDEKLIHRDIKPENMLLNRNNDILLSDFGLATVAHHTATQNTQSIAGTAVYMAPELFRGKSYPASDQYALGIVVYEWLTGQPPFNEGDFIQLGFQHSYVPPEPPREKNPNLPKEIEHVVMTVLAKDPKQRFGSVKAFANALEQACTRAATQKEEGIAQPPSSFFNTKEASQPPIEQRQSAFLPSIPLPTEQLAPSSHQSLPPMQFIPPMNNPIAPVQTPPPLNKPMITTQHSSQIVSTQNLTQQTSTPHVIDIPPFLKSRRPKQALSRRTVLIGIGIAGVALVGGGITWFTISQKPAVGSLLFTYKGHSDQVNAVAWSPNGQRIASGSADKTVQVWNATDGSHISTYFGYTNSVSSVAWSPNGQQIAAGSADKTVQVWNSTGSGHAFTYKRHSDRVLAVAWSSDGKRIASCSDATVQVWNATDGSPIFIYTGSSAVNVIAWSPDGQRIASARGSSVQVWNATDGSNVSTYTGHNDEIYAVAWSPDGKQIASGSADKTVQIWNDTDGSSIFTYKGHSSTVNAVAWSPDGQRIASSSSDNTVQVWNGTDGSNVFIYKGHSKSVQTVAWSPNGQHIASGGADKTVQVWQAV